MGDLITLPGEELNRRLEKLSLKVEKVSMLIEDAMVEPSVTIALERSEYNDLVLCLSRYEELLSNFRETTEETADEVREIVGTVECCGCETDGDDEIDVFEEDEDCR